MNTLTLKTKTATAQTLTTFAVHFIHPKTGEKMVHVCSAATADDARTIAIKANPKLRVIVDKVKVVKSDIGLRPVGEMPKFVVIDEYEGKL